MNLEESVQNQIDLVRQARQQQAPAPVVGYDSGPEPFGQAEADGIAHQALDRAAHGLGLLGKAVITPFSLTAEGLARTDDLFRGTVLTALGRMPSQDYGKFFDDAIHGKRRISGDEFNRLALGESLYQQISSSKTRLPDWVKMWMVPDRYVTKNPDGSRDFSPWSAALGMGSEVFASPFAIGSLLPRTALRASGLAGRAFVAAIDAPTNLLIQPFRLATKALLHPNNPFSLYLLQALGPETVLGKKLPDFVQRYTRDADTFEKNVSEVHAKLQTIFDKHKAVGKNVASHNKILQHLFEGAKTLTPEEHALADDLMTQVVEPLRMRASAMGYDKFGSETWDPADLLRQFIPSAKNANIGKSRPIGEQGMPALMKITVPWKGRNVPMSKMLPTDWYDHTDLATALGNFAMNWEKKLVFDARRMETVNRKISATLFQGPGKGLIPTSLEGTPNVGQFTDRHLMASGGTPINAWVQTTRYVPEGSWAIYAPRKGFMMPGENRRIRSLDFREFQYLKKTGVVLTGNRASHNEIGFNVITERFLKSLDDNISSVARKSRILQAIYDKVPHPTDMPTRVEATTASLVAGTMVSTLGLNLSAAVHNLGQLANTAAVEGIPATIRGLFRMAQLGETGGALRGLRSEARFKSAFEQLLWDPSLVEKIKRPLSNFFMAPFSATEMFVRGASFNVGLEKALAKQGIKLEDALKPGFNQAKLKLAAQEAKRVSLDTNFVYGLAGRGPLMAGPVARVAFALQGFSIKEAEFLARTWQRDGGSLMKWINLNGWAIDMMDKVAGVNAESWLGWGFVPPNTFGRGPQVETTLNLVKMLAARAENDPAKFEEAATAARGQIGELFRSLGADPDNYHATETAIQSLSMLGFMPFPSVGIARTAKAYNEFMTGVREETGGRYFRPVTKDEALTSWFFTTHRRYADQQLAAMDKTLRAQVGEELDRRAKRFTKALRGKSGDEVWAVAQELATPVHYKLPFAHSRSLGLPSLLFRSGDDGSFWAPPDMIENRVKALARGAMVPRAVLEMEGSGWTSHILWAAYLNNAFRELDTGGILPLGAR